MCEQWLEELASDDPRRRATALRMLRADYAPETGIALVRNCITESESRVWWLSSRCVIPIWLPLFDRTLSQELHWPFDGGRTLRVVELAKGHVLHSIAPHVQQWLVGPDWSLRFAAFRWLQIGGTMAEACEAASVLLKDIQSSFTVEEAYISKYFWMKSFNNQATRTLELRRFYIRNSCNELP
jgi:hypothetical protein